MLQAMSVRVICNEIGVANNDVTFEVCQKCSKLELELRRMRNEVSLLKIV